MKVLRGQSDLPVCFSTEMYFIGSQWPKQSNIKEFHKICLV